MSELVLTARDGRVLRLTLNRAGARNALSEGLMAALQAALDAAKADDSRVVVLAADGPAFSSGHDLKEMTAYRAQPDKGAEAFAALFAHFAPRVKAFMIPPSDGATVPPMSAEDLKERRCKGGRRPAAVE